MEKQYTREVHIDIGGETRRVLLCLWGLVLAEERGFDISGLEMDESAKERKGDLEQMLDLLWVGMLPFEEDLKRKDLGMQITLGDMEKMEDAIDKIVSRQITDDVREKIEEASANGRAEGKAPAASSAS